MNASRKTRTGNVPENAEGLNLAQASDEQIREIRGNEISMIFQEPMTSLNPTMKVGKQLMEVFAVHSEKYLKDEAQNK